MREYRNPALTADVIIIEEDSVVLVQRLNNPYKDYWALPGGFVEYGETVEHAAIREAEEETGLQIELDNLIGVYSDSNRDPRGHTVSVVYTASIVGGQLKSDSDAKDVKFEKISELDKLELAFDHEQMLKDSKIF